MEHKGRKVLGGRCSVCYGKKYMTPEQAVKHIETRQHRRKINQHLKKWRTGQRHRFEGVYAHRKHEIITVKTEGELLSRIEEDNDFLR